MGHSRIGIDNKGSHNCRYYGPKRAKSAPERSRRDTARPRKSPQPQGRDRIESFRRPEYKRLDEDHDTQNYVVGRRAVLELLKQENTEKIEKVYIAFGAQGPQMGDLMHLLRTRHIPHVELDRNKFRDLEHRASRETDSQGVIALVASRKYQELQEILGSTTDPLLVALDGVEDPHNIGAIMRSVEASGATAILMSRRGAVLTPAVYKASAGAASHVPIVKFGNLEQTIRTLKEEYQVRVIGLAGEAEKSIHEADLSGPICLVTGSEEKGLHRLTRDRCDELVRIPLAGKTESLNASVATAVVLFEALRQRAAKAG